MDIIAEIRDKIGKHNNLKLRQTCKVPAVIYFSDSSIPISINSSYSKKIIANYYNGEIIYNIIFPEKKISVILKDFYMHPCKNEVLHLDFQKIELSDIVKTKVFFKFIGEKNSVGIKHGGFLIKHRSYVNVECVLKDLPKCFEVDISNMEVNKSIFVSELNIPNFVKIISLNKKNKILLASIIGSRSLEQKSSEVKQAK